MMNKLIHLPEPKLVFGYDQVMEDPRDGLTLFGPYDRRDTIYGITVGVIGTQEGIDRFLRWLSIIQGPVRNPEPKRERPPFPGFEAVFGIKCEPKPIQQVVLEKEKLQTLLHYDDKHRRIYETATLYSAPIIRAAKEDDRQPSVWFVIVPDELYKVCRPAQNISRATRVEAPGKLNPRLVQRFKNIDYLAGMDALAEEEVAYDFEPDFRNQLKGRLLKEKVVTQILRESTLMPMEVLKANGKPLRDLTSIRADIAWNVSTAVYYKSGARPWKLHGVRPGVCYLGLVFKQDNTETDPRNACCAAQMFLDSGDGVVFKGSVGKWYAPETRQYHLSHAAAKEIVALAMDAYAAKNKGEKPKELFIHGRVRFNDPEWAGFNEGADKTTNVIGVRIVEANDLRLYRQGSRMPILRGLAYVFDRHQALLWTKGFVPRLQTFPGGKEVPKPIIVNVCRGEHDIEVVLNDVLRLTKLNYNCCRFADGMPVTLKFADAVGEILTSGPVGGEVPLPFKHYI
jgi:hypothetical protein